MISFRHLRNQFFHYHIQHGSGCKAEQIRHRRYDQPGCQNGNKCPERLHNSGQHSIQKGFPLPHALRAKWHGNNRSLREILYGNADGKCKCAHCSQIGIARKISGIDHADCHPLRNIVQCDCQYKHRCLFQFCLRSFRFLIADVQMWNHMIQKQQE